MQPLAPVIAEVRKVADMPAGRFAANVKATLDWIVPNVDDASIVQWVLIEDAMLRTQDGDLDGAWESCQAALNVARSLGDEPVEVVQNVRAIRVTRAIRLMERTLAAGIVPDQRLAETQALLHDEMSHPTLLIALRGSRAITHHCCTLLQNGHASLAEAKRMAASNFTPPGIVEEVKGMLGRPEIKPAHAWLVRYLTQAVEIAKQPERTRMAALKELEKRSMTRRSWHVCSRRNSTGSPAERPTALCSAAPWRAWPPSAFAWYTTAGRRRSMNWPLPSCCPRSRSIRSTASTCAVGRRSTAS